MIKINDIIKVEASASLGSGPFFARVDEFGELDERDPGVLSNLKVVYAEIVDDEFAGSFVCVTESAPHYIVDDFYSASLS